MVSLRNPSGTRQGMAGPAAAGAGADGLGPRAAGGAVDGPQLTIRTTTTATRARLRIAATIAHPRPAGPRLRRFRSVRSRRSHRRHQRDPLGLLVVGVGKSRPSRMDLE